MQNKQQQIVLLQKNIICALASRGAVRHVPAITFKPFIMAFFG
jgi:hypothetical protein